MEQKHHLNQKSRLLDVGCVVEGGDDEGGDVEGVDVEAVDAGVS